MMKIFKNEMIHMVNKVSSTQHAGSAGKSDQFDSDKQYFEKSVSEHSVLKDNDITRMKMIIDKTKTDARYKDMIEENISDLLITIFRNTERASNSMGILMNKVFSVLSIDQHDTESYKTIVDAIIETYFKYKVPVATCISIIPPMKGLSRSDTHQIFVYDVKNNLADRDENGDFNIRRKGPSREEEEEASRLADAQKQDEKEEFTRFGMEESDYEDTQYANVVNELKKYINDNDIKKILAAGARQTISDEEFKKLSNILPSMKSHINMFDFIKIKDIQDIE